MWTGPARGSRCFDLGFLRDCDGHRCAARVQPALYFALGIVGKFSRPSLREVRAVARAQPAGLTFHIGAELSVAPLLVNETIPNVDIDDAGLVGPAPVKVIEKRDVGGGF